MNTTVTLGRPTNLSAAETLYISSFPPEERRPWCEICSNAGSLMLFGLFVGDVQAGFVTLWDFDDFVYIEHFAVDSSRRGTGIGAGALEAVKAFAGKPLLLEVEPPEHPDVMARRRIAFYERCGFSMLDYDYIQPPYGAGLPSVPLRLMCTDSRLDAAAAAAELHCKVYGCR